MTRKKTKLYAHRVKQVDNIASDVYTLTFERQFDFVPGQVIAIGVNQDHDPRLYSIASGNNEKVMRILFDVNPIGFLTPQLQGLNSGDKIFVSEPFGKFVPSDKKEWWIATGTGIAPFVSMVKSNVELPEKLIHGSRRLEHFLYQDLFLEKLGANYMRFCTGEQNKQVFMGRLTNWLQQQSGLPDEIKYYLCGNPEMVVSVRDIILNKGIDFENIMAEIYF